MATPHYYEHPEEDSDYEGYDFPHYLRYLHVPSDAWLCVLEHVEDKGDQLSNRLICKEASLAYPECLITEYSERRRVLYGTKFPWQYINNAPAYNDPHYDLKLAMYHKIKNYSDEYDKAILEFKWDECPELIEQANQAVVTCREGIKEEANKAMYDLVSPAATPMS